MARNTNYSKRNSSLVYGNVASLYLQFSQPARHPKSENYSLQHSGKNSTVSSQQQVAEVISIKKLWLLSKTMFLGSSRVSTRSKTSNCSVVFAQWSCVTQWRTARIIDQSSLHLTHSMQLTNNSNTFKQSRVTYASCRVHCLTCVRR